MGFYDWNIPPSSWQIQLAIRGGKWNEVEEVITAAGQWRTRELRGTVQLLLKHTHVAIITASGTGKCHLQIWHCTAVYWYILSWVTASKSRTVVLSWFRGEWRGSNIILTYYFVFIASFPHLFLRWLGMPPGFVYSKYVSDPFLSFRTWIFLESTSTTILVSLITRCPLLMDLLLTLVFQSTERHSLVNDTEMSSVVSREILWAQRF